MKYIWRNGAVDDGEELENWRRRGCSRTEELEKVWTKDAFWRREDGG